MLVLIFFQDVDLPVLERMTRACKDSDLSKSPSELVDQSGAHAPQPLGSADKCSIWEN